MNRTNNQSSPKLFQNICFDYWENFTYRFNRSELISYCSINISHMYYVSCFVLQVHGSSFCFFSRTLPQYDSPPEHDRKVVLNYYCLCCVHNMYVYYMYCTVHTCTVFNSYCTTHKQKEWTQTQWALKGLNATKSQHFGTANFPANIASEKLKTSV